MKKHNEYKLKYFPWRLGDRRDGWRLRNVDPFFAMIPFFVRKRVDAQIFYQQSIPIDIIEAFVKEHKDEMPDLSVMHVFIAIGVRLFSQRPRLNRFVMRNKLYARKYINMSLIVKRSLTDDGEETLIKVNFLPTDTLYDVVRKVQQELNENQPEGEKNSADKISKILNYVPAFLKRFLVSTAVFMDRMGILPRALEKISPWHTSFFLVNNGSIGLDSVFHHLYNIGTCGFIAAMGTKSTQHVTRRSGEVVPYKSILLKLALDERICDGFYYSASLRTITRLFMNPEQLLSPPDQVLVDDGVGRKRIDI